MTLNWKEIWQKKGETKTNDVNWLDAWDETIPIDMGKVAKEIIEQLQITSKDRVLEVGCGAGALAKHIAPVCKQYIGIDYTPSLVNKHISILQNSVILSEADNIPFKDRYFDKSYSYSVFHYFPSNFYFLKALNEIKRVTKSKVFIGDLPERSPTKEHLLYEKFRFRKERNVKFTDGYWNPDRFNVTFEVD